MGGNERFGKRSEQECQNSICHPPLSSCSALSTIYSDFGALSDYPEFKLIPLVNDHDGRRFAGLLRRE